MKKLNVIRTIFPPISRSLLVIGIASISLVGCKEETMLQPPAPAAQKTKKLMDEKAAAAEAETLLSDMAKAAGKSKESYANARRARFTQEQNIFLPNLLAIDFKARTATLPLLRGIGPSGRPTYFIVTEAASYNVARILGVN